MCFYNLGRTTLRKYFTLKSVDSFHSCSCNPLIQKLLYAGLIISSSKVIRRKFAIEVLAVGEIDRKVSLILRQTLANIL